MKIVKYLFLLSLLGRSFLPAEEGTLRTDTRKWTSFESEADIANLRFKSASAKRVKAGVSEGEYALKLRFEPTDAYPSVNFVQPEPVDLRGYGGIAFDVYNPTDATVAFGIRIDSSTRADGKGNHSRSGGGSISPGRQATFVIPFGVNPAELGMKSLPGYGAYRSTGAKGRGPFDLGTIVTWQIFLNRPYSPAELIIDHVRLVPGREQDFTGMIDRYGQYAFTQWPGKIESDADFTEQRLAEDRDLEAHPAVAGRTQYGGWAEGPLLEATGFFRVEKVRGKWTFVDPEGRLFLSVGPTTVGAGSSTLLTGREPLFGDHPTEDPFLRRYTKGEENRRIIDYFAANLERKYG
nr:hypothetical protein [Kiritimatiellia bacterium]